MEHLTDDSYVIVIYFISLIFYQTYCGQYKVSAKGNEIYVLYGEIFAINGMYLGEMISGLGFFVVGVLISIGIGYSFFLRLFKSIDKNNDVYKYFIIIIGYFLLLHLIGVGRWYLLVYIIVSWILYFSILKFRKI